MKIKYNKKENLIFRLLSYGPICTFIHKGTIVDVLKRQKLLHALKLLFLKKQSNTCIFFSGKPNHCPFQTVV